MRSKNPNAVAGGRTARDANATHESWCDGQHAGAKAMGVLVRWQHNQPASRIIRGRLQYAEKSGCDYDGLLVDGRPFASEAKTCEERLYYTEVKPLQRAQLDDTHGVKGLAHLLVEFRSGDRKRRFAVRWIDVPWRKLRTALSISLDDMRPEWEVPEGECYLARGRPMPVVSSGRRRIFQRE